MDKLNDRKVEYSREGTKIRTGRLAVRENDVQDTWKEDFQDLYNAGKEEVLQSISVVLMLLEGEIILGRAIK